MILFSFLPALLLIIFICRRSPINVPKFWIAKAFAFGIVSAVLAAMLEYVLGYIHEEFLWYIPVLGPVYEAFVVAAIPEECCKLLMLWIIVDQYPFVDDYTDCLLFSVAVGLGFAAIENAFYLAGSGSSWLAVALARGLISVPGHYAFAVLMGFFFAHYYFDRERFKRYRWLILAAPIMVHGIYDVLIMLGEQTNDFIKSVLQIAFFGFVIRLHKNSYLKLKTLFQRDIDTDYIEHGEVMLDKKGLNHEK